MSDHPPATPRPPVTARTPVTDWATDWDFLDPRWMNDPFPIWDALRQSCPIAHTERFDGVYLPTRWQDIRDIAYDTASFSSRKPAVRENAYDQRGGAPPISSDPPMHRPARMALLPPFTPQNIDKLEPHARTVCNELIDAILVKAGTNGGHFDGAVDYAQSIPVRLIAHMLGVPESDGDMFRRWINEILQLGTTDREIRVSANMEMKEYFAARLSERRANPGDDLISYLSQQRYPDGEPFRDNHVIGSCGLLLVAGIDTTWSGIGASIWHLAKTPADLQRLVAEPALIPTAIEEFLRAYAPVTMAREIAQDTIVAGCPMKRGEMVMLSFPAANRDPAVFPDADKVIIDRKDNRHAAFGLGIHRCIGSNLARLEMRVAVEELLKRVPQFHLAGQTTWSEGTVRGPRILPLRLGA
jgi:cytochrome P450